MINQTTTPMNSFESSPKVTEIQEIKPVFGDEILSLNSLAKHIKEISNSNEFPVDALPAPVREIVFATNEALNFPIDFISASLLHAASTAIGNTHLSKWKWKESCCLYMAIVGNPGTIKTHNLSFANAPIVERDRKYYSEYEQENERYKIENAAYAKDKKNLDAPPKKPELKKHVVSDCTIEALAKVLLNNPRGICSHNDELAGWVADMNKYSGGNGDIQKWLSIWSSQPIVVDRSSAPSIRIERPFVNVIGTIQPAVIDELAKDNKSRNGFLDRILFVKPKGLRRQGWNTNELDRSIVSSWFLIMAKLLDLDFAKDQDGKDIPNCLWFTKDAQETLLKWQQSNINEDSEFSSEIRDSISAKVEIYVLRFSLIIQLLKYACGEAVKDRIEKSSVESAIQIARYFKATALEITDYINSKSPIDRLPDNKQTIYRQLTKDFATTHIKAANESLTEGNKLSERALEYWLNDKTLFKKIKHGHYQKIYE